MTKIFESLRQVFNSCLQGPSPNRESPAPALVFRDEQVPRFRNDRNRGAVLGITSHGRAGGAVQRSGWSHDPCENWSDFRVSGRSSRASSLEGLFSARSSLSNEVLDTVASLKNQSGKDAIEQLINLAVGLSPEQKAARLQWAADNVSDLVTPQDLNHGINEIADTTLQEPLDDAQKAEVLIALVSKLDGLEDKDERNAFFVKMQNAAKKMAQEPKAELLEALAHAVGKLHPLHRAAAFYTVATATKGLEPLLKNSVLGHLAERISHLIGEHEMINAVDLLMRSAMQGQPQASFLFKMTGVIHHFTNEEECSKAIDMMFAAIEKLDSGLNQVLVLKALARQIPLLKNEQARSNLFDKTFDAAMNLPGRYRSEVLQSLNDMTQDLSAGEASSQAREKISNVRHLLTNWKKEEGKLLRIAVKNSWDDTCYRTAINEGLAKINELNSDRKKAKALSAGVEKILSFPTKQIRTYALEQILTAARTLPPKYSFYVLYNLMKQVPLFPAEQICTFVLEKTLTAARDLPLEYRFGVLFELTKLIPSFLAEQIRTYVLEKTLTAARDLPLNNRIILLKNLADVIKHFEKDELKKYVTTLLEGAREELQRALRDRQTQQRPRTTRQTAYHA